MPSDEKSNPLLDTSTAAARKDAGGATQRTSVSDTYVAGTTGRPSSNRGGPRTAPTASASTPNRHDSAGELTKNAPCTVTTVPPTSGPKTGVMSNTRAGRTYVRLTRVAAKSAPPLVDTATTWRPTARGGATHVNTVSDCTSASTNADGAGCNAAGATGRCSSANRHTTASPDCGAGDVKPDPVTVMVTPPWAGQFTGFTAATAGRTAYTNVATSWASAGTASCGELRTATDTAPRSADGAGGVAHSTADELMNCAGAVAAPPSNAHRSASLNAKLTPVTVRTVPPVTGPLPGDTARVAAGPWNSTVRPSAVKSTPLAVTSTVAAPTGRGGATHVTVEGDTHVAGTWTVAASRYREDVSTSADTRPATANEHARVGTLGNDVANRARTVTRKPPRSVPESGASDATAMDGSYRNDAPTGAQFTPPLMDSSTPANPGAWAGVTHLATSASPSSAAPSSTAAGTPLGSGSPPNRHRVSPPGTNPVPVNDTVVPPNDGPWSGDDAVTVASHTYSNTSSEPPNVSTPFMVTVTATAPAPKAGGDMHCNVLASSNDATTDWSPNRHARRGVYTKLRPVMVTRVAPSGDPRAGDDANTDATGMYRNATWSSVKSAPAFWDTATLTVPAGSPAGVTHDTWVSDTHAAGTTCSPNRHRKSGVFTNPDPMTATVVAPSSGAHRGSTPVTRATDRYRNSAAENEKSAPFALTRSATGPACCANDGGAVHRSSVLDSTVAGTLGTSAPNRHAAAASPGTSPGTTKLAPVTVTTVPPVTAPDVGLTVVTSAKSTNVNSSPSDV